MRTLTPRTGMATAPPRTLGGPPAAYSSYYPGHSFRIPSSPTRLANIAECFALFPKLWALYSGAGRYTIAKILTGVI